MTYAERVLHDAELRQFVAGEIARAGIDVQVLRVELAHQAEVIAALKQQVQDLSERKRKR